MSISALIILFVFGLAAGSFINVVALRYNVGGKLFAASVLSGRSLCPKCGRSLRWFELIPLVSFFIQRARCRSCGEKISWRYPLVEILAGLIFVYTPLRLEEAFQVWRFAETMRHPIWFYILAGLWIGALLILLLIALIDFRTYIIPDSLNVSLLIIGLLVILTQSYYDLFGLMTGTFVSHHALLFGLRSSLWGNHFIALFLGLLLFGGIVLFTRGRGMGLGDVKLISVLGFLFGWPDILLIIFYSFVIGAIIALFIMALGRKKFKDVIPFGPFIAIGAALTVFFGLETLTSYFSIFPIA